MSAVLAENEEAGVMDECSGSPSPAGGDVPPVARAGQAEGFTLGLKLAPGTLLPPLLPLLPPAGLS